MGKIVFSGVIPEPQGETNLDFVSLKDDQYIPLVKIFDVLGLKGKIVQQLISKNYPYSIIDSFHDSNSILHGLRFRQYMGNSHRVNNKEFVITNAFMSFIGYVEEIHKGINRPVKSRGSIFIESFPTVISPVIPDIFSLLLIKKSKIPLIDIKKSNRPFRNSHITVDSKHLKLLISREKFKSVKYMADNYNKTVRQQLMKVTKSFLENNNVEAEIVSDSEILKYTSNPYSIKENSLLTLMKIDEEIKDSVFSNLKERLIV